MDLIRRDLHDPWRVVNRFHDVDRLCPWRLLRTPLETTTDVADWVPAVDIKEEDERFLIRADVPGVDAADLEITMEKGVLSLQGSRETRW